MSKLITGTTALPVTEIEVPQDRLRTVSEAKVRGLMEAIGIFGFTTPIEVRRAKGRFVLIDGAHRLEAMKRLGEGEIAVRAFDISAQDARGREIAANLVAGMTPLQDAVFLAAWQGYYEELHPETRRGVAGGIARQGGQLNNCSFAELVASNRSVTPRQIRKATAAVRRLTADELRLLDASARPVPLDAIEKIGKIADANERANVVERLASGQARNVAAARHALAVETGVKVPPKDPLQEDLEALNKVWSRAGAIVRRRFVAAHIDELRRLIADAEASGE
ncbi:ParB/RepB/Spo0J family partition protein [Cereibacter johrii]|uniref:ParB/RepB/Spo0J family partition protein n=1 Tax=Cereibacter johrii TaxID=445629 RepID=UPI000DCD2402|nr:ParB N-terminal domain-containing protein [Cereibacter johrii]RAZ84957.1 chromosome partitioning protein ParB [Cereibacter johrii]